MVPYNFLEKKAAYLEYGYLGQESAERSESIRRNSRGGFF
mgnify:CR=1 FL=1